MCAPGLCVSLACVCPWLVCVPGLCVSLACVCPWLVCVPGLCASLACVCVSLACVFCVSKATTYHFEWYLMYFSVETGMPRCA